MADLATLTESIMRDRHLPNEPSRSILQEPSAKIIDFAAAKAERDARKEAAA